jgi:hypothetical protein
MAVTLMVNAASETLFLPSVTLILMLVKEPTLLLEGVPLRRPVVVLKAAQLGMPVIEKVSTPPLGSVVAGWKA